MVLEHCDRGGLEISRASVVTEALPCQKHLVFRCARQGGEIGKPPEPLAIIRDDGGDLGLLEHDLGDEDCVRILCATPGELPAVAREPAKKRALEGADFFWWSKGSQQALNVQCSTSNVQFRVEH